MVQYKAKSVVCVALSSRTARKTWLYPLRKFLLPKVPGFSPIEVIEDGGTRNNGQRHTIQMGGSIGKMVGCVVNASPDQTRTPIAAGAGLATAFNAPLAGILFVTEEARPQFESWITSFRSVMIAYVTATIVVRVLLGQGAFLKMSRYYQMPLESLWMFVVLGIGLGVVSK